MGRPRADELLPVLAEARPKLSARARRHAAEVRCPRRHLLAAVVRTPYGAWLLYRGGVTAPDGWLCAWADEIVDPTTVYAWCRSCPANPVWVLDLSDQDRPERRPPPGRDAVS